MKKKLQLLAVFFLTFAFAHSQEILISQYLQYQDGFSSDYWAIEVWNPTSSDVALGGMNALKIEILMESGGTISTNKGATIPASGVVVFGNWPSNLQTLVEANGATYIDLSSDLFVHPNGDDAIRLMSASGSPIFDLFGQSMTGPWSGNGVSSEDQNIKINSGITTGDTDGWTDPSVRFSKVSDITDPSDDSQLSHMGVAPGVAPPESFNASAVSGYQIDLSWIKNIEGNDVIVVAGKDVTPVSGTAYTVGEMIDGAEVIYKGNALTFFHAGLDGSTLYRYSIFSYDAENNYSFSLVDSATTFEQEPSEQLEIGRITKSDNYVVLRWLNDKSFCDSILIKGSDISFSDISVPSDQSHELTDTTLMVYNVSADTQQYIIEGLDPAETYYFKFFPYNNAENPGYIDYKTSPVTELSFTTDSAYNIIFTELVSFENNPFGSADSSENNYIEIYNAGGDSVNMEGWRIVTIREGGCSSDIYEIDIDSANNCYETIVVPGESFVMATFNDTNNVDRWDLPADMLFTRNYGGVSCDRPNEVNLKMYDLLGNLRAYIGEGTQQLDLNYINQILREYELSTDANSWDAVELKYGTSMGKYNIPPKPKSFTIEPYDIGKIKLSWEPDQPNDKVAILRKPNGYSWTSVRPDREPHLFEQSDPYSVEIYLGTSDTSFILDVPGTNPYTDDYDYQIHTFRGGMFSDGSIRDTVYKATLDTWAINNYGIDDDTATTGTIETFTFSTLSHVEYLDLWVYLPYPNHVWEKVEDSIVASTGSVDVDVPTFLDAESTYRSLFATPDSSFVSNEVDFEVKDLHPPVITYSWPQNGEVIDPDTLSQIILQFNERLTFVDVQDFIISVYDTDENIDTIPVADITLEDNFRRIIIPVSTSLENLTKYYLQMNTGASLEDKSGNVMSWDKNTFTFSTKGNGDASITVSGDIIKNEGDKTIANIPWWFNEDSLLSYVHTAVGAYVDVYEADGVTETDTVMGGYQLVITSDDSTATNTYTLKVWKDLRNITVDVNDSLLLNTLADIRFSLNSTNGADGTFSSCTAPNTTVIYPSAGDYPVWVRETAYPDNVYKVADIAASATAPDYSIDYFNETTAEVIPSSHEYSWDGFNSDLNDGTGTKLPLNVDSNGGETLSIRISATDSLVPSNAKELFIPNRAAVPAPNIDYVKEIVPSASGYEYAIDGGSYTTVADDSVDISSIIPASSESVKTFTWRVPATASSFLSETNSETIDPRPAAPVVSIDYPAETITGMNTTMEYSTDAGTTYTDATGATLDISSLIPGHGMPSIDIDVRYKAVASTSFSSEEEIVEAIAREKTPALKLSDPLSSSAEFLTVSGDTVTTDMNYEYNKNNSGWNDITTGLTIDATGDNTIVTRKKATSTSFKSKQSVNIDIEGFLVTFNTGTNGYISSGNASQIVQSGGDSDPVQITANDGYEFSEWQDSYGNFVSNDNPLTVTNVSGDTALFAVCTIKSYQVDVLASENGTGTVDNSTPVYNTTVTFTAQADEGYHFGSWESAGGQTISSANPLDLTVISDTALKPVFIIDTFKVEAVQNANGIVQPGDSMITYGSSINFIITPDAGFRIEEATINSLPVLEDSIVDNGDGTYLYKIDSVLEDIILDITFSPIPATLNLTILTSGNGTVVPGDTTVTYGSDVSFTITPDNDNMIDSITVNDVVLPDDQITENGDGSSSFVLESIKENKKINIIFITTVSVTGIEESEMLVYPNPVKDKLVISYNSIIQDISLINMKGTLILKENVNGLTHFMDMKGLAKGVYLLQVETSNKIMRKLIIKE